MHVRDVDDVVPAQFAVVAQFPLTFLIDRHELNGFAPVDTGKLSCASVEGTRVVQEQRSRR